MKHHHLVFGATVFVSLPWLAPSFAGAQVTGPAFYGDPPDDHHPWAIHDRNRPQPKLVAPGTFSSQDKPGKPPSDAIVLFGGTDLSGWLSAKDNGPAKWKVTDGAMQCVPKTGDVKSKAEFGDCQLHIEWSAPSEVKGNSQGRGNSGVFLMGVVEVQVLDNFKNPTYADGFAASVYGINPPMANPLHAPGEWQVYDIVFRRPIFKHGKEVDPGYITVFCNGVLVQDHTPLEGPGGHKGRSKPRKFPEKGPIKLQDHGNTTRFRNIWYRPLPPRAIDGGTDGKLTKEATAAKRMAIAASIREDAGNLNDPHQKLTRLMESLVYHVDPVTTRMVSEMAGKFASETAALAKEQINARKGQVLQIKNAIDYLTKFKMLPAGFEPKTSIDKIVDDQGWKKRR